MADRPTVERTELSERVVSAMEDESFDVLVLRRCAVMARAELALQRAEQQALSVAAR